MSDEKEITVDAIPAPERRRVIYDFLLHDPLFRLWSSRFLPQITSPCSLLVVVARPRLFTSFNFTMDHAMKKLTTCVGGCWDIVMLTRL